MAKNELAMRLNWQTLSGVKALEVEDKFKISLQLALDCSYPGQFVVERHPKEFSDIYSTYNLPDDVTKDIYNIDLNQTTKKGTPKYSWGISMDFAIRNKQNNKILFGEIKRQDGWTEKTDMAAGRGNAHERSCKYFTPGLMKTIRERSGISEEILPFWVVLVGDITRDPRRNREIAFWYQGYENNFFMWRDTDDLDALLNFFEENLLPFLL